MQIQHWFHSSEQTSNNKRAQDLPKIGEGVLKFGASCTGGFRNLVTILPVGMSINIEYALL